METVTTSSRRAEAIDLARGLAVALMILSHGVKGLLSFEQIPEWGIVPIHLVTKFASSLFILVFGISISMGFLRYVDTPQWHDKRRKLLVRGLVVFFWYKILTIVEMFHLYPRTDILQTLLYQAFPVYVEILGFYAIALFWVPFFLSAWVKMPVWLRILTPLAVAYSAHWLYGNFDFGGNESLQALLVEHEKHYTWGQIARAPLVFVGLLLGEVFLKTYHESFKRIISGAVLVVVALALLGGFFWMANGSIYEELASVAMNEGKHPPEIQFMLFSLGGAFGILGLTLVGGDRMARIIRPMTTIGRNALQAFIFHVFVIFVLFRFLFDYWRKVSYEYALFLTLVTIGLTAVWIKLTEWTKKSSSA